MTAPRGAGDVPLAPDPREFIAAAASGEGAEPDA